MECTMSQPNKTIREKADDCRAKIDQLRNERKTVTVRSDRKALAHRIEFLEVEEVWLRSRHDYD